MPISLILKLKRNQPSFLLISISPLFFHTILIDTQGQIYPFLSCYEYRYRSVHPESYQYDFFFFSKNKKGSSCRYYMNGRQNSLTYFRDSSLDSFFFFLLGVSFQVKNNIFRLAAKPGIQPYHFLPEKLLHTKKMNLNLSHESGFDYSALMSTYYRPTTTHTFIFQFQLFFLD